MRDAPIPDFAALHPGYVCYACYADSCPGRGAAFALANDVPQTRDPGSLSCLPLKETGAPDQQRTTR